MPFELSLSGWDLVTYKVGIGTGFVARHFNKFDLKKIYIHLCYTPPIVYNILRSNDERDKSYRGLLSSRSIAKIYRGSQNI